MGYESKFYVVDKSGLCFEFEKDGLKYAKKIAEFDLSKVYDVYAKLKQIGKPTDCYIFADDGNTRIIKDDYGDPLLEIAVDDMIRIIDEVSKNSTYRRYKPFLSLLKGFDMNEWNNLVVLHYGY